MNVFGTILKIERLNRKDVLDDLLERVVKKSDERKLLRDFLLQESIDGEVRFDELKKFVETSLLGELEPNQKDEVIGFCKKKMESAKTLSGISLYRDLVLQLVEKEDTKMREVAIGLRKGLPVSGSDMPNGFPGAFKTAETLVMGKLRTEVGEEEYMEYTRDKRLFSEVSKMAKHLFFAVNNGLVGEKAINFLAIMYEVEKLQAEVPVNLVRLKQTIVRALVNNEVAELVHIKCLRFVYPKSGGVEILTHTDDVEIEGVSGKYIPKSETRLFERLKIFNNIFKRFGVRTSFTICSSDEDLELLFPKGNTYISAGQSKIAYDNARDYIKHLVNKYGSCFSFTTITELSGKTGGEYHKFRTEVLRDILRSGGRYVNPDYFEKDRVDHQYAYYQELLGATYSREEARRSIAEQTASVISLRELLKTLSNNVILIEENRYGENKLIANGEYPVVFTVLRDPKRSLV
ncbi:MAG: hypothetical protein AAB909_04300 [Patescibacteria group bacterium]